MITTKSHKVKHRQLRLLHMLVLYLPQTQVCTNSWELPVLVFVSSTDDSTGKMQQSLPISSCQQANNNCSTKLIRNICICKYRVMNQSDVDSQITYITKSLITMLCQRFQVLPQHRLSEIKFIIMNQQETRW